MTRAHATSSSSSPRRRSSSTTRRSASRRPPARRGLPVRDRRRGLGLLRPRVDRPAAARVHEGGHLARARPARGQDQARDRGLARDPGRAHRGRADRRRHRAAGRAREPPALGVHMGQGFLLGGRRCGARARSTEGRRLRFRRDHPRHGDAGVRGVARRLPGARARPHAGRVAALGGNGRPTTMPPRTWPTSWASPLDHEALRQGEYSRHQTRCETQPLLPGVVDRAREARAAGLRTAVASSSLSEWVEGWLTTTASAISSTPSARATRSRQAKPAPDLFLLAAARLGRRSRRVPRLRGLPKRGSGPRGWPACAASRIPNPLTRHLPLGEADLVVESLADHSLAEILRRGSIPRTGLRCHLPRWGSAGRW